MHSPGCRPVTLAPTVTPNAPTSRLTKAYGAVNRYPVSEMPRITDSRTRMLKTAAQLLRRQGYAATGWRQVVTDSHTPWGSVKYHFPGGKEQLAAEAVTLAGSSWERMLRAALADGHPADAISRWTETAARELEASSWADGCPVATVALETAHSSDTLATACDAALTSWHTALSDALEARDVTAAEATSLATLVLAGIEGALLLARARRNAEPLRLVGHELAQLLRNRTG